MIATSFQFHPSPDRWNEVFREELLLLLLLLFLFSFPDLEHGIIFSQLGEFSIIFYNDDSVRDRSRWHSQVSFDHGHDLPPYPSRYTSPATIIPFFHYEYLRISASLQSFQCRESLNETRFRFVSAKLVSKVLRKRKFSLKLAGKFRCLFTNFSTIYSHC